MKNQHTETLLDHLADFPSRLAWAERQLSDEASARALLSAVDESPFGLRDWVDALISLDEWLESRNLAASLPDQLGYLTCASESAGGGANLTTLHETVKEMLKEYGFEAAVRKEAR